MARPTKDRKVCTLPKITEFSPTGGSNDTIVLSVDEYETIRLIDKEDFSQEECAAFMLVARTTVQQIYNRARRKVANALVDGKKIVISGGSYSLCQGTEENCNCGGCEKHKKSS